MEASNISDHSSLITVSHEALRVLIPLNSLQPHFLEDLIEHMAVQTVFSGQVVFEIGAYDRQHIYLVSGEIKLEYANGHIEIIKSEQNYTPLSHQFPRICKATAMTDSTVVRVDSDRVDRTLSWSQVSSYMMSELSQNRDYDEDITWMKTVLNSNLFLKVPPVNAEMIFDKLTPMVVYQDEVIVRQGEIGDCCYFIKEGDAQVIVRDEATRQSKKVAQITEGRCFGEDALVNETVRNANVVMLTDGVLMRLEKSDFLLLLQEPSIDEVTVTDVDSMLDEPIYIDVRSQEEFTSGHLAFSANIPLSILDIKKRLLSTGRAYVLYCDSGRRSKSAAYLLGKQGYNVMTLKDGINGQKLNDILVKEEGYILKEGVLIASEF